jgi:ribosomal protein L35AE/L33A
LGASQVPKFQEVRLKKCRSKVAQNVNQTILRLEGVNDRSAAQYYFGKRVAYIYKTHSGKAENRFRVFPF